MSITRKLRLREGFDFLKMRMKSRKLVVMVKASLGSDRSGGTKNLCTHPVVCYWSWYAFIVFEMGTTYLTTTTVLFTNSRSTFGRGMQLKKSRFGKISGFIFQ